MNKNGEAVYGFSAFFYCCGSNALFMHAFCSKSIEKTAWLCYNQQETQINAQRHSDKTAHPIVMLIGG